MELGAYWIYRKDLRHIYLSDMVMYAIGWIKWKDKCNGWLSSPYLNVQVFNCLNKISIKGIKQHGYIKNTIYQNKKNKYSSLHDPAAVLPPFMDPQGSIKLINSCFSTERKTHYLQKGNHILLLLIWQWKHVSIMCFNHFWLQISAPIII